MANDRQDGVTEVSDTSPAFGSTNKKSSEGPGMSPSSREVADEGVVKVCEPCMESVRAPEATKCPQCGGPLSPIRATQDDYVDEVVSDKYRIVEHLGSGGMAEVYLGLNEPLGQRVAIKFLNESFTNDEDVILRFLNEARSYCKVNHPNAVTLLEYGQHEDGALYIITEYVEGDGLTELVEEHGALDPKLTSSIAMQCCEVLSTAHEQGVIHRDLKPDNIMLMEGTGGKYDVKILDFGIAKILDDEKGPMTETGSVFGTPEFMSPEQAKGESGGPGSDIYALGIVMFYMLTGGALPFKDESQLNVLNMQLEQKPPAPSSVADRPIPESMSEIVLKCLAKEPEDRFGSAEQLYQRLERVEEQSSEIDSLSSESLSSRRSTIAIMTEYWPYFAIGGVIVFFAVISIIWLL